MKNKICIGLDFEQNGLSLFNVIKLISETKDLAYCYKINPAFWLSKHRELDKIILYLNENNIKWIYDGKLGDVLHTNENYAYYLYNIRKASGATLNPYLGYDSLEPFNRYGDKLNFVVCRTTNDGSEFFQNDCYKKSYEVAKKINAGIVIASNKENYLKKALEEFPDTPILSPGIGAQGGKITVKNKNIIYSVSRSIINSAYPAQILERLTNE